MPGQRWMCPFCEWATGVCRDGGPDLGLVIIHLSRTHEETTLYPRSLVSRSHRQMWLCPFCANPPWHITWEYDFEGDDPDVGLMIGEHMDAKHPEAMYTGYIPQHVRRRQLEGAGIL